MNVIVLKEKLDALAEAIGIKSKVRLPLTIDEQIEAVNLIKTDPKLQDKSVSLTPKATAQTATVTADSGYDGLGEVAVNVQAAALEEKSRNINASGTFTYTPDSAYIGMSLINVTVPNCAYNNPYLDNIYTTTASGRKWRVRPIMYVQSSGWIANGYKNGNYTYYNAIPTGTTITPTTETQTIGAANTMLEGAITVNPIPNNYGLITHNGSTITVS